jgi:hypothetical protein
MTTWVNAGTVTVTNASTTVTGAGTNWVGPGVQPGYAFVGPTGDIYEIVTVVSDTSLTIAPAYRGSTASGQPYAIAPTRGLVQVLIDRANALLTYLGQTFDWKAPDGTAALPGIAFSADTDTGFLRPGANQIGASTGGVQRWLLSTTGLSLTLPVLAQDGTAAAPALTFSADTDTGLLRPADNQIGAATGGVQRWLLSTTALTLTLPVLAADGSAGAPVFSFSADPDTGMWRVAADTLAWSTGGVAGLRLDSTRRFIIGGGASQTVGSVQAQLQVQGVSGTGSMTIFRYSADAGAPLMVFAKSRAATVGTNTVVQSGDNLGDIQFYGVSDTSAFVVGAGIVATTEAAPASGGMQTTLRFATRNSGGSYGERVRLASDGNLGIGTTAPTAPLHVNGAARVGSFTVGTVPSASGMGAGAIIYVSNESGGAVHAFSDGTNWRRVTDRAIIS